MAEKKKPGGQTGRPAFSEPRVQVFTKFGGCNFQLSPREFDLTFADAGDEPEQTDLFSNLMVIQNNAAVTPNQTIETRQNLVKLFGDPGTYEWPIKYTGVATLIGDRLYAACNDMSIHHGVLPAKVNGVDVPGDISSVVTINDQDAVAKDRAWTFLGHADDNLVGMTAGKQIWTGAVGTHKLENATVIPDPATAILFDDITPYGELTLSATMTETEPFRVSLQYTLLNKYGPTKPSPMLTFYASKPTTEWSGAAFIAIEGVVPGWLDIIAVELYYAEDEWQEPNFLTRINLRDDLPGAVPGATPAYTKSWMYTWTGYLYDTSTWLVGNLTPPTQNYTQGVEASMMACLDGQLYFWGGSPEYRIWIGGNPGNRFSVSTGTGGGFVDCEPGVGTVVTNVLKFKTQQGASIVTALCDSANSQKEHRFNLVETSISLSNEQSAKAWQAERVAGTVGCKSRRGAVVAGDGLYAISRYGLAITTLTMEYNSQLQVQYVSDAIEPVFLKQFGNQFDSSHLFVLNDIVYMTFGKEDADLDNVIFCYDIARKAWWTYTLDLDTPILGMLNIDYEGKREGIGIIVKDAVYLLPTTHDYDHSVLPLHDVLIETAELSTVIPLQSMHHLSQLEFRFDYFIGDMDIIVQTIDQFGRKIDTRKHISHATVQHQLAEYIRIDQVVESYKIIMKGKANMRLTHFMAKLYPKPARIGMAWGFDSRQSHTSAGSIHRTFSDYNDLKDAIIP